MRIRVSQVLGFLRNVVEACTANLRGFDPSLVRLRHKLSFALAEIEVHTV